MLHRKRIQHLKHLAYPSVDFSHLKRTTKCSEASRTEGIAAWPLNRLRTRLSIPFGFLQLGSTHL